MRIYLNWFKLIILEIICCNIILYLSHLIFGFNNVKCVLIAIISSIGIVLLSSNIIDIDNFIKKGKLIYLPDNFFSWLLISDIAGKKLSNYICYISVFLINCLSFYVLSLLLLEISLYTFFDITITTLNHKFLILLIDSVVIVMLSIYFTQWIFFITKTVYTLNVCYINNNGCREIIDVDIKASDIFKQTNILINVLSKNFWIVKHSTYYPDLYYLRDSNKSFNPAKYTMLELFFCLVDYRNSNFVMNNKTKDNYYLSLILFFEDMLYKSKNKTKFLDTLSTFQESFYNGSTEDQIEKFPRLSFLKNT